MKKQIHTQIQIQSSPAQVWSVLTDFDSYPDWNPFVRSVKGTVALHNTIEVDLPGMNFKPVITSFKQDQQFSWLGHLGFKGLFDGEHSFQLIDNQDGSTTFVHSENFKGILVRLFSKTLDGKTKAGFEEMNESLKIEVEKRYQ